MNSIPGLTESDWREVVMKDWKGGEFEIVDYNVDSMSEEMAGFLSEQLKVKVSMREVSGGDNRVQHFHYFVKYPPNKSASTAEYVKVWGAIEREVTFYSEISSDLKVNEIAQEECCECVPTFYLVKDHSVVMEDLTEKGYTMIGSRTALSLDHCRLVLKALANFHTATFVFEERKKRESPQFVNFCDNPRYHLEDEILTPVKVQGKTLEWIKASFVGFKDLVKILPKYKEDEELCRRISEKMSSVHQRCFDLVRRSDRFRNVVCHGDLWSNNIMFRHDTAGKPVAVKFLDYQFVRYLPPATDVMFFLYAATTRQFRKDNEDDLLRFYYSQLVHNLTTHGLSPGLLPEGEFRESCDQMRELGIIMSATYAMTVMMPLDFLPAVITSEEQNFRFSFEDRGPEVCQCFNTDEVFRERTTEIMEEFIDECVIPIL